MPTGTKKEIFPDFEHKLKLVGPSPSDQAVRKLAKPLADDCSERETPKYIFINPELLAYSELISEPPESVLKALFVLSVLFPNSLKEILVLKEDGLFYVLQEEDLEQLTRDNLIHNPFDPRVVYHNARDLVRHGFVIGC